MVSNPRRLTPVIKALAVQMAAQRADLDTDARLYLAEQLAHVAACYGLPGTERIVDPQPPSLRNLRFRRKSMTRVTRVVYLKSLKNFPFQDSCKARMTRVS